MTESWVYPDAMFDSVALLTDEALVVANPKEEAARELIAARERGEDLAAVVEGGDELIPYASISKVLANQRADEVYVHYRDGKGEKHMHCLAGFPAAEQRNDFFEALQKRLGSAFERSTREYSPAGAALKPSAWSLGLAALTWLLHSMAAAMAMSSDPVDVSGRRSAMKRMLAWAVDFLGPNGVLVVGGITIAIALVVLVKRVKSPPIMMRLIRQ